jgi:HIT domain-containing protein
MRASGCPFCNPAPERVFLESDLIVGVWDAFPLSDGHALLVTRRHATSWFEATEEERSALMAAIDSARRAILRRHRPDRLSCRTPGARSHRPPGPKRRRLLLLRRQRGFCAWSPLTRVQVEAQYGPSCQILRARPPVER